MLTNLENNKFNPNDKHRYIIVQSSMLDNLSQFRFDKIHSCYLNNKIERLNIKLDYEFEEDAVFDVLRCNFTDSQGKYIVVKI